MVCPFNVREMSRLCGSGISSAVTRQGPIGRKGIGRFAAHPLPVAFLNVAGGHVVGADIARNVLHGVRFGNLASGSPDYDGEFRLIINFVGNFQQSDNPARIVDGGGVFREQNGAFRYRLILFFAVVAVVLPDAHDFLRIADGSQQPNIRRAQSARVGRVFDGIAGRFQNLRPPRQKRGHRIGQRGLIRAQDPKLTIQSPRMAPIAFSPAASYRTSMLIVPL